jgi:apolipoprotein N-acyltransferase
VPVSAGEHGGVFAAEHRGARRWRAGVVLATASVLAGALLTLAFEPYGLWWLAPVPVAALTWLVRGRRPSTAAWLGFGVGLGFFVPLLHWSGVYVGPAPWLILAAFEALYLAPLGAALALVQRLPAWPVWAAGLWVAQEAVRMRWPYGGFPWGRLAFSQADAPTAGLAALGGAPLVSYAVALAGSLVAAAVVLARGGGRTTAALLAAAAVAVTLSGLPVPSPAPAGPRVTIAVIQGNVPRLGLDFNAQREAVLRNHVTATLALADRVRAGSAPRPDLVIWPENSSDIDPYASPSARALIDQAVDAVGVPVLVGAVVGRDATTVENTAIVWSPETGPGDTYIKRHPVPFGEYIPMRSLARRISTKVDLVRRDFAKGDRVGMLQVGPARVGDVICFEVGDDGLVRDAVRAGGQVVVVQTNNATFGRTPQTEQQLEMSRLRAIEHGRTVLVAATSGVSAVVDSDGTIRRRAEVFTAATFVEPVVLSDRTTLATRVGAAAEWTLVTLGVAAALVVVLPGIARRRRTHHRA